MNEIPSKKTAIVAINANGLQSALVVKTMSSEKVQQARGQAVAGLVKPEDEPFLTGETSDQKYMVNEVVYTIPDTKLTIKVWIDMDRGVILFDTEDVLSYPKIIIITITTIACTPLECIKSFVSAYLHPSRGYIKAKVNQRVDMQLGDKVELNIADLYTIGDQPSPTTQEATGDQPSPVPQEATIPNNDDKKGKWW